MFFLTKIHPLSHIEKDSVLNMEKIFFSMFFTFSIQNTNKLGSK